MILLLALFYILNNNLNAKVPSDVKLLVEGSGSSAKYYIQRGADSASKKPLLGSTPRHRVEQLKPGSGQYVVIGNINEISWAYVGDITRFAFWCNLAPTQYITCESFETPIVMTQTTFLYIVGSELRMQHGVSGTVNVEIYTG